MFTGVYVWGDVGFSDMRCADAQTLYHVLQRHYFSGWTFTQSKVCFVADTCCLCSFSVVLLFCELDSTYTVMSTAILLVSHQKSGPVGFHLVPRALLLADRIFNMLKLIVLVWWNIPRIWGCSIHLLVWQVGLTAHIQCDILMFHCGQGGLYFYAGIECVSYWRAVPFNMAPVSIRWVVSFNMTPIFEWSFLLLLFCDHIQHDRCASVAVWTMGRTEGDNPRNRKHKTEAVPRTWVCEEQDLRTWVFARCACMRHVAPEHTTFLTPFEWSYNLFIRDGSKAVYMHFAYTNLVEEKCETQADFPF